LDVDTGTWIWLWHWLPCNPIVWMVLELVGGIGAQYRAPLPHEGKSPPTIPRSPALYSPEITSLPFPDPRAYPFATHGSAHSGKKKSERLERERQRRWRRRQEVDPHGESAISRRPPLASSFSRISDHLPSFSLSTGTSSATLIYFPFLVESSIFNLRLPRGSILVLFPNHLTASKSIEASFLLPPSIHSFQTLTTFLWI